MNLKQGDFVKLHNDGSEVFKIYWVDSQYVSLIDAQNRHKGYYSLNEVKKVSNFVLVQVWREINE